MPNQPSQVVRDLNLNSGDAVELHITEDILRMAEGVAVSPGISLDVNRADAGLDTLDRNDVLLDSINRDFAFGQATVIGFDTGFDLDTEDRARRDWGKPNPQGKAKRTGDDRAVWKTPYGGDRKGGPTEDPMGQYGMKGKGMGFRAALKSVREKKVLPPRNKVGPLSEAQVAAMYTEYEKAGATGWDSNKGWY